MAVQGERRIGRFLSFGTSIRPVVFGLKDLIRKLTAVGDTSLAGGAIDIEDRPLGAREPFRTSIRPVLFGLCEVIGARSGSQVDPSHRVRT